MLGFSSAAFISRPKAIREDPDSQHKHVRKKESSRRFLVQRQGYLRNSKRIMELGAKSIAIFDLALNLRSEIDVSTIMTVKVGPDEFSFTLQLQKSAEAYSCLQRAELLSVLLPIVQGDVGGQIFSLLKWSKQMLWAGSLDESYRKFAKYRIWSGKITVIEEDNAIASTEISIHEISKVQPLADDNCGLVLMMKNKRIIRFTCLCNEEAPYRQFSNRDRMVRAITDSALAQLGITLPVENIQSQDAFVLFRLWNASSIDNVISSFAIQRLSKKSKKRIVSLSSNGMYERDVENTSLVHHTIAWSHILHFVRYPFQGDEPTSQPAKSKLPTFAICTQDGKLHRYELAHRDEILTCMMEIACRQGIWLSVAPEALSVDWRMGGSGLDGDKEYEDSFFERLSSLTVKEDNVLQWVDMANECNCNFSGSSLGRVLSRKILQNFLNISVRQEKHNANITVPLLMAFLKLLSSRSAFEEIPLLRKDVSNIWTQFLSLILSDNDLVSLAVTGAIRSMIRFSNRGISDKMRNGIEKYETANSSSIVDNELVSIILEKIANVSNRCNPKSPIAIFGIMEIIDKIFTCRTSMMDSELAERMSRSLSNAIDDLCGLCRMPNRVVCKRSTQLLITILQDADEKKRIELQNALRSRCILLPHIRYVISSASLHLSTAVDSSVEVQSSFHFALHQEKDTRALFSGHMDSDQADLSANLIELLVEGNPCSMDLLSRILPASLFSSLRVPWQESATATLQQRGRSARVRSAVNNWPLLFQRLRSDLSDASLIWNESTRNELREALQEEEEALIASIEVYGASNVTWNDEDFFVHYRSLEQEVRVGAYYLRFVLFDDFDVEVLGSGASRFLGQLYHSFLTEQNPAVKVDCLLAMSKVYKRWSNQPFDSLTLSSLVRILADTDCSKNVRNALIDFLQTAICNPVNARNLLSFPLFIPSILQILSSSMSSDYVQMDWISMDKIGMTIKCANLLHVLVSRTSSKATNKIVRPLPLAQRVLSKDERVRQVVWLLLLPNETFLCRMLEIVEILLQQSGCCSFLPATKSLLLYLLINCVDFSRSIQSGSEQGEAVKDSLLEKAGKMIGQMWEGSENNNSCTCKIEVQETMLDLIPISLFLLLKKEGATSFVRTLSSERKDVSILWTRSMRERMSQALKLHLCRTLREEQEGKIGFERMPKIVYNEHIESDWLGCEDFGYYLSHLESSSSMVSPTDIVQFRQLILQRLADASTGLSTQAILLSLLANIMEENHVLQFEEDAHAVKQSEETEEAGKEDSSRFAEFKILAGLLKEDAMYQEEAGRGGGGGNRSPSRERMMVQMNVMRVCRWMVKASPDSSSTVSSTVSLCIQLGIADFVDSVLKQCISCMFVSRKPGEETNVLGGSTAGDSVDSQSESDCILQLTLAAIRFASDFARYPEGLNRWEREQGIVHVLLLCLQSDHSDIIQAAIECMGHVCSSQLLHAALIRGHFHLLLLRQLLRDVFAMTDGADRVTVSIVSIRTRCLSTCQALYSFAFGKHNTQEIQEELVCLLTAPMLERLDSAAEFLGIFAAEHRTPDLVWGSCNRRELRSLVKKTFKHLNVTSPQINEQPPSWPSLTGSPSVSEESASMSNDIAKFSYSNICNLTRVGGIYIEIFNDQPNWPLEDPATLLGKLFDAMAHGVEGNEMTDNQKVEAMKAALNIAKRLPSSSVLSSPTRIVLLADLLPAQEDFWEQEVLSGDQGSEGTSANSKQGKWKLYVLVFELLAVGSQDSRAAKILCEQGVAQRLLGFLNASLGIFSPSLCLDESHQAEAFDSSASCRELKDCLESVVVSTLRCLRQVSRFLPSQFRRLCQESYLTVLLLLLFKDSIPMSLRAEAASSISEFCTSENAERMKEYLKMVCPRHLVSELARPRKEDNQILHVVLAVDQDVKTEESEWNRDDCQEVLTFLCESRQNFSWEISRLSYLEKQESRRVGDYLIDNLNILLKEGKDQSQLIKDPASFFRICSEEVKHNTDTNEAIAEWPDGCERLKQVLESLGWLARGGLVPRSVWDEKAICLVPSLMKVLSAMSRSSHPIRPSQLRQIMRVLLPAVSCEGVSEFFRIPDNVRSLIWMVMEGSRHEDAAGEEVLAASVHILAAMMRENSSIVELVLQDGIMLSQLKAMAERREPNVLHLMGEMLAHPSMGESVRLAIPERTFWDRVEEASPLVGWDSPAFKRLHSEVLPSIVWRAVPEEEEEEEEEEAGGREGKQR